jgi:predicted permease
MLRLDGTVLAYTMAITLAAGIITGLVPAVAALRAGLYDALKDEGRSSGSLGQRRLRGVLVIAEIAAAMVLLVGSSLLIRTFLRLQAAGLGFDPKGVLTLKIAPSPRPYPDVPKRAAFCRRILENARAIPGVETAAIGDALPLVGSGGFAGVSFEGRPQPPVGGRPSLPVAFVSLDYFQALKIPIVRGRAFTEADRLPGTLPVIVNQAFAEEFYPGENALGKRIGIGSQGQWKEIVGISANVKAQGRGPVDPYLIYVTIEESFDPETFLILKSSLPLSGLVSAATKAVHAADAAQPVYDVSSMEDRVSKSLATQRANMTLMGVFAALALILATVGIFGVIAYFVNSRVQEIAIRMALGASGRTVVGMVLSHGMALASAGIAAGIGGALILARTLGSLVEGIGTSDAVSFVAASLVFGIVAAMACSIPARRAARVDPMAALRHG